MARGPRLQPGGERSGTTPLERRFPSMLDHLLEETAIMTSRTKLPGATAKGEAPAALPTFAAALLAATLLLGACNTVEGMGDDAEDAGEEVEDAID